MRTVSSFRRRSLWYHHIRRNVLRGFKEHKLYQCGYFRQIFPFPEKYLQRDFTPRDYESCDWSYDDAKPFYMCTWILLVNQESLQISFCNRILRSITIYDIPFQIVFNRRKNSLLWRMKVGISVRALYYSQGVSHRQPDTCFHKERQHREANQSKIKPYFIFIEVEIELKKSPVLHSNGLDHLIIIYLMSIKGPTVIHWSMIEW